MIYLNAYAACCALGGDLTAIGQNLAAAHSGLQADRTLLSDRACTYLGKVSAPLEPLPEHLKAQDSRNNRLLYRAWRELAPQFAKLSAGVDPARIGIVLGTSTSGLGEAEGVVKAVFKGQGVPEHYVYAQQELGSPSTFLQQLLQVSGPCYTISTACSSSLRAIISGYRLLQAHLCDVVIVGGADALSAMPVNGFHAMGLVAIDDPCAPFGEKRAGISIGEGAGLMVLSRQASPLAIVGLGESSDAYHISSPHPQGRGAQAAMLQALKMANISASELAYVNLHGTGTTMNDAIEAQLMANLAPQVPCSSTKYLTGHTLGACGAIETIMLAIMATQTLTLPAQDFTRHPRDPSLPEFNLLTKPTPLNGHYLMNNAFAFGGNNAALILQLLS